MADDIQQQLAAARRSQILQAAAKVFAEKGFHNATIRDVAQAAGVADGTIYNYFANKAALMLSLLDGLNQTSERAQHFEQQAALGVEAWTHQYVRQRYASL